MEQTDHDAPKTPSWFTRALQAAVLITMVLAIGVSCTPTTYVKIPDLRPELIMIGNEANACTKQVEFQRVEVLPVTIDRVKVDGKAILTITPESVENIATNLSRLSDSADGKIEYIKYLQTCLRNIAKASVVKDDKT